MLHTLEYCFLYLTCASTLYCSMRNFCHFFVGKVRNKIQESPHSIAE